ncbi:hypothetical protein [Metaclostridioides mangenotii]|jgi:uncharacterized integral membrane protein|uniref:Integral membrane protein n=1 Tax=Metaclostridioides mangenotii TaxID=1540 RepID=A0ABS4E6R1_9FIRM|nr:hypothetical protein [Clostridioides mangenotii]MBP1853636.1 putative integral membrane protein [Clostridioides mangenotii]
MSRLERTIERKQKNNKYKLALRIIFILIMIVLTVFCIFEIDSRAKNMLGEKEFSLPYINLDISNILKNFR